MKHYQQLREIKTGWSFLIELVIWKHLLLRRFKKLKVALNRLFFHVIQRKTSGTRQQNTRTIHRELAHKNLTHQSQVLKK